MTYIVIGLYVVALVFTCAFFRWKARRDREADNAAKLWIYRDLLGRDDKALREEWLATTGEDYESPALLRIHLLNLLERLDDD